MLTKKRILLYFVFVVSFQAFGQKNTDVQSRLIPSIEFKLNKKWKFSSEYRFSLENNLQKFRSSAVLFETKYSLTKRLTLSGEYRFTTSFEEDNHRLNMALGYDYKINKKFTVSPTTKYQYSTNKFDRGFINEFKAPENTLRQKIDVEFNVPKSKFSFKASAEVFVEVERQLVFDFDKMRYTLGLEYNFKEYGKLGFSVFYDCLYKPDKDDRIVLVTKYSISLRDLIKKKK